MDQTHQGRQSRNTAGRFSTAGIPSSFQKKSNQNMQLLIRATALIPLLNQNENSLHVRSYTRRIQINRLLQFNKACVSLGFFKKNHPLQNFQQKAKLTFQQLRQQTHSQKLKRLLPRKGTLHDLEVRGRCRTIF